MVVVVVLFEMLAFEAPRKGRLVVEALLLQTMPDVEEDSASLTQSTFFLSCCCCFCSCFCCCSCCSCCCCCCNSGLLLAVWVVEALARQHGGRRNMSQPPASTGSVLLLLLEVLVSSCSRSVRTIWIPMLLGEGASMLMMVVVVAAHTLTHTAGKHTGQQQVRAESSQSSQERMWEAAETQRAQTGSAKGCEIELVHTKVPSTNLRKCQYLQQVNIKSPISNPCAFF